MTNSYENPPIEEAVVEFRFAPGPEWDLTIPGKMHEHRKVKNVYKGKPRNQKIIGAAWQSVPQQPRFMLQEEERIQLIDHEGVRLVSLGKDLLGIIALKPYEGWKMFRPRVEAALAAYNDVAQPTGISRVGVRYINKFEIEGSIDSYKDYLNFALPSMTYSKKSSAINGFKSRISYDYEDGVLLFLTLSAGDVPEGRYAILIDVDIHWEGSTPKPLKDAIAFVDELHEREKAAFEGVITNIAREAFDAD